MIDIDKIERLLSAGVSHSRDIAALIAEVRALREALSTPIAMKIKWSPMSENMVSGFSQPLGEDALTRGAVRAKNVTVYYGEKRIYTCMAAFCAAHPREKA